jgi:DNA transformation protein
MKPRLLKIHKHARTTSWRWPPPHFGRYGLIACDRGCVQILKIATTYCAMEESRIETLRNLGPASARMLEKADIADPESLRQAGALNAFFRVKRSGQNPSLNLLWALEGALTNKHWSEVAKEYRTSLLLALEDLEKAHD